MQSIEIGMNHQNNSDILCDIQKYFSEHAAWRFLREVFGPIVFGWQPWRGRKVAVPIGKPLMRLGREAGRQTLGWRRGRNALSPAGAFLGKHQSHSLDRECLAQDESSHHSWYTRRHKPNLQCRRMTFLSFILVFLFRLTARHFQLTARHFRLTARRFRLTARFRRATKRIQKKKQVPACTEMRKKNRLPARVRVFHVILTLGRR